MSIFNTIAQSSGGGGGGSIQTATSQVSGTSTIKSITFNGVDHEPSWFVCLTGASPTTSNKKVAWFLYNGSYCSLVYGSAGSTTYMTYNHVNKDGNYSASQAPYYTYNNGQLTLGIGQLDSTSKFMQGVEYTLYYL